MVCYVKVENSWNGKAVDLSWLSRKVIIIRAFAYLDYSQKISFNCVVQNYIPKVNFITRQQWQMKDYVVLVGQLETLLSI